MPLSIEMVPSELLLQTLQKTNLRTLCRLRQTEKWIDSFVEENRFRISARGDSNLFLFVNISNEETPRAQYRVCVGFNYDFKCKRMETTIDCCIEYPYKQLAALHFYMETAPIYFYEHLYKNAPPQDDNIFINQIWPTMLKMRIDCDWLNVLRCYSNHIEQVLNSVKYSKLNASAVSIDDVSKWPISNCEHLEISFTGTPACLSQFFNNAISLSISLDRDQYPFKILAAFLTKATKDKDVWKKLKTLDIVGFDKEPWNREFHMPGIEQIWKGVPHQGSNCFFVNIDRMFYKLKVDGGFVVLMQSRGCFEVPFVDEINRNDLLLLLEHNRFHQMSYDLSASYDDFMNAESDQAAFNLLHDSFPRQEHQL